MVVQRFRIHHLSVPLERPMANGTFGFEAIESLVLELDVGDATGTGYAFCFEPRQADAIRAMVTDLCETLIDRPVDDVRAVWNDLWHRIAYIGRAGPPVMALSVVDTALWDLLAQRAQLPLFRLLGASSGSPLPVYVTGGWLTYSKEELAEEAVSLRDRGFAHYKMKVGHPDWRRDVERVEYVRGAAGDGLAVMVDANQAFSVTEAIAVGRAFGELGVTWFEEPIAAEDLDGCARVTAAIEVPVASGESLYTRQGFLPLVQRRAADVLMPDLMRSGGPTEFLQIAALGETHAMPVSSHAFQEISAHLMAACPNAGLVEVIPGWSDGLFDTPPIIAEGRVHLSERPGLGFKLAERAVHEFETDEPKWQ
jgi:mandelate racemase